MHFEKWQALGNDYVIVEREQLPFVLTPPRVQRLCDRHTGVGADGVLQLEAPDAPGFVARLRIFNPDGSEAELSGNGAREAILYLRARGWTDSNTFSVQTAAGEIRPTITSATTCTVDMGRARLASPAYPDGPPDGRGELAGVRFQHVHIGNPQCAIRVAGEAELAALDLPALGPAIEHAARFPQRTNVSSSAVWGSRRVRGRARPAPRSRTSCAAATRRSPSTSTGASSPWTSTRACTSTSRAGRSPSSPGSSRRSSWPSL